MVKRPCLGGLSTTAFPYLQAISVVATVAVFVAVRGRRNRLPSRERIWAPVLLEVFFGGVTGTRPWCGADVLAVGGPIKGAKGGLRFSEGERV